MTKKEAIKIVRLYFPTARVVKYKYNQYDGTSNIPKRCMDYEIFHGVGRRFAWGAKTSDEAWIKSAESFPLFL